MGQPASEPNALTQNQIAAPTSGAGEAAMRLAGTQLGLNEVEQNGALREFMADGGVNLDPATQAWCAAFVQSALNQVGVEHSGNAWARSFENVGTAVDTPQRGDLAVFSRGAGGHVGFFDSYAPDGRINVLGGNQSNSVSVAPYATENLLSFRRI